MPDELEMSWDTVRSGIRHLERIQLLVPYFFHELNELCQVMCVVSTAGLCQRFSCVWRWRSSPAMNATIGVLAGGIIKNVDTA